MVKLCSKEVQESSEKRMRRQTKPAVNVSGEEDALTLLRTRLGLIPRKPCRSVRNQPLLGQIVDVVLENRRPDPIALDPAARQARPRRRSAPVGFLPLRLRRRLFCSLQSHHLLLPHCSERSLGGAAAPRRKQIRRGRGGREGMGTHCAKTPIWCFLWTRFRVTDLWVQAILSNRATATRAVRGEKGGHGDRGDLA